MFNAESEGEFVVCPYNPEHRFLRKRLQAHLLNCRKNYPDVELRKCPFNVTHLIPEAEFIQHKQTCQDRKLFEHYKYVHVQGQSKEMESLKHNAFDEDENWDIEY